MGRVLWLVLWLAGAPVAAQGLDAPLHHELKVSLQPGQQSLRVVDTIVLPEPAKDLTLYLHAGLNPRFHAEGGDPAVDRSGRRGDRERYRLLLPEGATRLRVEYAGRIHHPLSSAGAERARGFRNTAGLIDADGVFLSAASLWYPQFEGYAYLTANMQVELPAGWSSVSQGERQREDGDPLREHWSIDNPQEEIYLIAARFTEYSRSLQMQQGKVAAQVFLRGPDPKLADKYLEATAGYLKMYEQLLGPYAYGKFALVENFWETGFGMPSFTLLGPRVIRLPFILNSSYPHEILHNWWGNGVYVDFAGGNWSEGLTAYLADHLIKEQQGGGAEYRLQSLQKYRDYAASNRDFPLTRFRGRHSSATEAVGYGKTLMLFHMLRKQLGDRVFVDGLQTLYRDYRFRIASFGDVERAFEQVTGRSLGGFFRQWVERSGAPELSLKDARVEQVAGQYRLHFSLEQVQPGEAYELDIPLAVTLEGRPAAQEFVVSMTGRRQAFALDLPAAPLRMDVDPQFDLFRKLALAETPPAFTRVFGADELLVVLPHRAKAGMEAAWERFAGDVSQMGPERVRVVSDDEIDALPDDQAVMLLGWDNRFAPQMQEAMEKHPLGFESDQVKTGRESTERRHHAFAWVTRVAGAGGRPQPRAWIAADLPAALPGLGRKLPHYHKYSYLAFEGEEPENRLKGRWPVTDSPMSRLFTAYAQRGALAASPALIDPVSVFDAERMLRTIRYLSDPQRQGRGLGSDGLEQAAEFIADAFREVGLQPGGDDGGYFQSFSAKDEGGQSRALRNVVGVIPGRNPKLSGQRLVIGAHYDHLGLGWPDVRGDNRGKVHYGADDNASGVAVLLELARVLNPGMQPDRSIVFVAFSAEEAGRLGSKHYVKPDKGQSPSKTFAMLNLDTVGRLHDGKLMVLGAETASEWPHLFRGIGFVTGIQTAMVNEPLDASDQISFHEAGVPAVQLFSGPNTDYHRPGDSVDKIDADGLLKVAEVGKQVLEYLAGRAEPLNGRFSGGQAPAARPGGGRKVSLGSIPDFTYQGEGYRLDGVVPGSPAERAGLAKLDVIVAIDDTRIKGLRDVSAVLKTLEPGQTIDIRYLRDGESHLVRTELAGK